MARTGATEPLTVAQLEEAERLTHVIVNQLREIAHGIFPAVLAEEGLAAALIALVESVPRLVVIEHVEDHRYDPNVEMAAYAVIDETVVGGSAHARDGVVRLSVRESGSQLEVDVLDEGWDPAWAVRETALADVGDRVGALGGTLAVTHPAAGGTCIKALIPLRPGRSCVRGS